LRLLGFQTLSTRQSSEQNTTVREVNMSPCSANKWQNTYGMFPTESAVLSIWNVKSVNRFYVVLRSDFVGRTEHTYTQNKNYKIERLSCIIRIHNA